MEVTNYIKRHPCLCESHDLEGVKYRDKEGKV